MTWIDEVKSSGQRAVSGTKMEEQVPLLRPSFLYVDLGKLRRDLDFSSGDGKDVDITSHPLAYAHPTSNANMPSLAYNPRMSMAGSSQQASQQKQQRKEDDGDAFMTLVRSTHGLRLHDHADTRATV